MILPLHQQPAVEAGDPAQFCLRLAFLENLDPGGAAVEEDLSWGEFQLWVKGRNLCEHVDHGEVRLGVRWYLLPLLEWLTENWDYLLHEQRPPVRNAADSAWQSLAETHRPEQFDLPGGWDDAAHEANSAWAARHALRTCQSGGLFPDLVIRRWRHTVELSWGGNSPAGGAPGTFRFLYDQGCARLAPDRVASPLHSVLWQASERLRQAALTSARLATLCQQIAGLTAAGRPARRTAILAGLGGCPEEWERRWHDLRERLAGETALSPAAWQAWLEPAGDCALCVSGSCEAAVMFGSASPTLAESDVFALAVRVLQATGTSPSPRWRGLTGAPQRWQGGATPWREGYELAREWAAQANLEVGTKGYVDIESHLTDLGVNSATMELSDVGTSGLALQPVGAAPHIIINTQHPRCQYRPGQRFLLAHELCHLLHDCDAGQGLAVISGPWAPRELEQRANAFAAALLMPYPLLQQALGALPGRLDFGSLLAVARSLRVSPTALAHHLQNVGLIDEVARDGLLDEVPSGR